MSQSTSQTSSPSTLPAADSLARSLSTQRKTLPLDPSSSNSMDEQKASHPQFSISKVNSESVHYVQSHGQGESHWRGRATLFSHKDTLYEGYHTHKPGSFSWPFDMILPEHPDPKAIAECKHQWDPKEHFLSTADFLDTHAMPPTFKFKKWGFGFRFDAFVEYVFKVTIEEADEGRLWKSPFAKVSTLPIRVAQTANEQNQTANLPCSVHFSVPEQLNEKAVLAGTDRNMEGTRLQTIRHAMRSSRLLQVDKQQSSLLTGLKDKARSVVSSESLPKYSFDVVVKSSNKTQLLVDGRVKFLVNVRPVTDPEATSISRELYPEIRLDNVSLVIEAATYVRFKSWVSDRVIKSKYDIVLCDKASINHVFHSGLVSAPTELGSEIESSTDAQRIDVVKAAGISTALISAKLGKQTEIPLMPTFNTYVIAREYRLNWRMEFDVAGEKVRMSNEDKLDLKVTVPEESTLVEVLKGANIDPLEVNGGDHSEDEVDAEEHPKTFLQKLSPRKSKQQEAAEDHAAESSHPSTQNDEALPAYQSSSAALEYRHEIADRPPDYRANT